MVRVVEIVSQKRFFCEGEELNIKSFNKMSFDEIEEVKRNKLKYIFKWKHSYFKLVEGQCYKCAFEREKCDYLRNAVECLHILKGRVEYCFKELDEYEKLFLGLGDEK